jgi:hypothetical protein
MNTATSSEAIRIHPSFAAFAEPRRCGQNRPLDPFRRRRACTGDGAKASNALLVGRFVLAAPFCRKALPDARLRRSIAVFPIMWLDIAPTKRGLCAERVQRLPLPALGILD